MKIMLDTNIIISAVLFPNVRAAQATEISPIETTPLHPAW